ncbi:ARM repeat-containing protein [Zopfia rhizophila CBS 207.26]|uniref:ARM repeat-containing protein n=1 Tax=Zopfia rhizophila CBS 207.26 TaxID=1314779 RepID=A0A6A6DTN9_9PEZI|nr:ARM repeat-containing protein [Zopfia rhizophila CBS 207.26]
MAGLKRKSHISAQSDLKSKSKKIKVEKSTRKPTAKRELAVHSGNPAKKAKIKDDSEELVESDTSEEDNEFYGFAAQDEPEVSNSDVDEAPERRDEGSSEAGESDEDGKKKQKGKKQKPQRKPKKMEPTRHDELKRLELVDPSKSSTLAALNASSSREAHAKQKALAKERKAAKPNADMIERSKKLWEKLRLKSHIEKEERQKLVNELFEIVTGRVKDFVFKHDSVRVIQCAIKYSTMEQRRVIAKELEGEFRTLAEGKYSKFLIAKLLEKGDPQIRDIIISEFYGNVRRLINHPEAAWILDDTYRAVATSEQKARLLREWYGPEFFIKGLQTEGSVTADLSLILKESPEKRKPIMDSLETQINQLVQKKLTGFTMLHDAMLQYFLACKRGSSEANDFLEHLKPDATLKEGDEADNVDLLKNLAFTRSGSRLVSLALAYGTAKDRKLFLRPYKDTIEMMAYDVNAHHVLLAALAVVDDTKLASKSIFGELLPSGDGLPEKVLNLANDTRARTVLLYPFAGDAKWLMEPNTLERLSELYAIRSSTSKKDPNIRSQELARAIEPQLLSSIAARTTDFASSSFGLQFMTEALVGAPEIEPNTRRDALTAVVGLSQQILDGSLSTVPAEEKGVSVRTSMLKRLVQGGKYDPEAKKVVPVEPALGFADMFWKQIKSDLVKWATGPGSFVIVGLVESDDFRKKDEVLKALKKERKQLEAVAGPTINGAEKKNKKEKGQNKKQGNAGARILLEKL